MAESAPPGAPVWIETARLFLKLPAADEAGRMLDYYRRNRAHLRPWEPWRAAGFYTPAWWRQHLAESLREFASGCSARLAVLEREEPEGPVIGVVNFSAITRRAFHAAILGYSIDAEHEGRGLMREALEAAIRFGFEDLRLHRIMASYRPENVRSAGLLQRLGFVREGYARDYLRIDGRWRDHVLTAIVNPDWVPFEE